MEIPAKKKRKADPFTFIDLFSGCGGFSLGLESAGFTCLAALDSDTSAVETYKSNFPDVAHVLKKDLKRFRPEHLDELLGGQRVDVIIGGPPCQGFSHARQVDGANHGERLVNDARRYLYRKFLAYVAYYQPLVFVMENVLGIRSASGGDFFAKVQVEARALGYRVHSEEIKAWEFGVPQKRERQLIVGTRRELPIFAGLRYFEATHAFPDESHAIPRRPVTTLWEAIGDLPRLDAGNGEHEAEYDIKKRNLHLNRYDNWYLQKVIEISKATKLTSHVARPHSKRDLRDFARLCEGEHSAEAIARGARMEFPYDRENFKDRFTRQHRNRLCSTIVAHLSKDGLMFIHPTQNRSLTPREAARIQSFPDWYNFPKARTHAFRLIGNAVPPLVGHAVGKGLRTFIEESRQNKQPLKSSFVPRNETEALDWLAPVFAAAGQQILKDVSRAEFLRAWSSIGFLHYSLHPASALENGKWLVSNQGGNPKLDILAPDISSPEFELSGWPVTLVPIALEAHRRFVAGELTERDYHSSSAHMAGANHFTTRH